MAIIHFRKQVEMLVGELIGSYTLSNGQVVPAIFVVTDRVEMQPNTAVEGVEVILEELLPIKNFDLYTSSPVFTNYSIRLVQWSGSNLNEIVRKLTAYFDGSVANQINVPEEMGPTRQAVISVPTNTYYAASASASA